MTRDIMMQQHDQCVVTWSRNILCFGLWTYSIQHSGGTWEFPCCLQRSAECDFMLRVLILQCTFVAMCKSCCCCFVVFIISVLLKVWMNIADCRKWFKLLLCWILTSPGPILNYRVIVLIVHQELGFRAGQETSCLYAEFQNLFILAPFAVSQKWFLLPAWKF